MLESKSKAKGDRLARLRRRSDHHLGEIDQAVDVENIKAHIGAHKTMS